MATKKKPAKKTATKTAKKAAAKKAPAKKAPPKKTAAKKAPAKKAAPKKAAAKTPAKKAASSSSKSASGSCVPAYVKGLAPWQVAAVNAVEALVLQVEPATASTIKWSHPVFEVRGRPFALVRASAKHVLFGFWGDGAGLSAPGITLEGDSLRHVKIKVPGDLKPGLATLVRQAIALNCP